MSKSESDEYCSDEDVRLVDCEEVKFEFRDEMAGVSFTKDGEEGWTPVKRRRRRRSRDSDSNDEIRLPKGASISYMQVGGTPMLTFATRRARGSYPIASRTRKKDRVCYNNYY